MARFGSLLAVAIGGAAGSLTRWGLLSRTGDDRSTLTLLGINVFGSLLLGLLIGNRERLSDERFTLLGTGFAGGLTTFSTFAVAIAQDLEDGALLSALTNALSTMVTVVIAGGLGYRLSRVTGARGWPRLPRLRRRRPGSRRRPRLRRAGR